MPCSSVPLGVAAGFHCVEAARSDVELCQGKMSVCIKVMSYRAFIVLCVGQAVGWEEMCQRTLCKHA